jgi:Flavodoxin domain
MKALVVYESIFGNTRAVAEAVAKGLRSTEPLKSTPVQIDVIEVGHAPADVSDVDLLVVGGPIHAWGMSRELTRKGAREQALRAHHQPVSEGAGVREWLSRLIAITEHPQPAAAFDTAVKTRWFPVGSAAKGEAAMLKGSGHRVIAPPEHFYVKDLHGPMFDGELDRAERWGAALAHALQMDHRAPPARG